MRCIPASTTLLPTTTARVCVVLGNMIRHFVASIVHRHRKCTLFTLVLVVSFRFCQIISGVGVTVYWASTFVFDVLTYLIPCAVFLSLLYAFDVESEMVYRLFPSAHCLRWVRVEEG